MEWSKVLNEWVIGGIVVLLAVIIAWSLYSKTDPGQDSLRIEVHPQKAIYWQPSQYQQRPPVEPWDRN